MAITLCSETVATHHNLRAMSHSLAYVDAGRFYQSNQPGYVYIMEADGIHKVGCSDNPERRAAEIRRACGSAVSIVKVWPTHDKYGSESTLHGRLWRHYIKREWFNIPHRVLSRLCNLNHLSALREDWSNVKAMPNV
jgi:hypothetical protein